MKKEEFIKNIADQVWNQIDAKGIDFMLPWVKQGMPYNLARLKTKNPHYYGINNWVLWFEQSQRGYKSNVWGTLKQIKDAGGELLEKHKEWGSATQVMLWQPYQKETTAKRNSANYKKGDKKVVDSVFMKFFWVYNMDQTTLADKYKGEVGEGAGNKANVESYVANTKAIINHGGDRCFYKPDADYIQMVEKSQFNSTNNSTATQNYYSVLLHELTHWTGHKSRVNRDLSGTFGDDSYAFEELIAEMGAAVQCCMLGVTSKPKKESAQYIDSWKNKIKEEPDTIIKVMSAVNKAVSYLDKLQEVKVAA